MTAAKDRHRDRSQTGTDLKLIGKKYLEGDMLIKRRFSAKRAAIEEYMLKQWTPRSAKELADRFGCSLQTAHKVCQDMVFVGKLQMSFLGRELHYSSLVHGKRKHGKDLQVREAEDKPQPTTKVAESFAPEIRRYENGRLVARRRV